MEGAQDRARGENAFAYEAAVALFRELGMPFWAGRAETEAAEDPA